MRRHIVFALTILVLGACSTKETDFQPQVQDDVIFYASFEQPTDVDTKVYANEKLLLRWTADDRVSIFNKLTYNQEYKFLGETGDNAGGFIKVDNAEFATGNPISHVVAVYPYQESTKISEGEVLTVTLPAGQSYARNTYGLGANTMVSVSTDNVLLFRAVGGYLVLKLYGAGVSVSSVTLKGNKSEPLAGQATVATSLFDEPSLTMKETSTEEITLTCANPIALGSTAEDYTEFWFVLPPTTFSEGFTITVTGSNGGTFEKSTSKSLTIERNALTRMAPIEVTLSESTVPPDNEIWYTSTNGMIVEPTNRDGFGASIISNTYEDGKGIIRFDGPVSSIGLNAFSKKSTLNAIYIPESVTTLEVGAFLSTSLTEVTIPQSVKSFEGNPFYGCYNLARFDGRYATQDGQFLIDDTGKLIAFAPASTSYCSVPDGVSIIGRCAFYGCWLNSLHLPDGLLRIEASAFRYLRGLERVELPSSLEVIGSDSFEYGSFKEIVLPDNLRTVESGAFAGCPNLDAFYGAIASEDHRCLIINGDLKAFAYSGLTTYSLPDINSVAPMALSYITLEEIILPETVSLLGGYAFLDAHIVSIVLPKNVVSIGPHCFSSCDNLKLVTIYSTTPPTLSGLIFTDCPQLSAIYVPSQSVEAYKTAQYWSDYADRIFPIEGGITASKYLTFTSEGATTISLTNYGDNAPVLYYSTDKTNWTQWDYSELTFTAGAPIYICGDNPDGFSRDIVSRFSTFTSTGDKFGISGDVMALIDKNQDVMAIPFSACFASLFKECSQLTSAPSLQATLLRSSCYYQMFYGCTGLTTAPDLPASTLAEYCYEYMFYGCTSLKNAPVLPATTLKKQCYYNMFSGCSSLSSAPNLPATILADFCYCLMFSRCRSLLSAPNLPATTLTVGCYSSMFSDCSSLISAPVLPATTLTNSCYYNMFDGCSNLLSAPNLPATILADKCYRGMFWGCTSLTSMPDLPATVLAYECYRQMFWGCSGLMSTSALPATTLANKCYYQMFENCSSLLSAPDLPATTLTDSCYSKMFYGCRSLLSAPALPATTLTDTCYSEMFYGCSSLLSAPALPAATLANQCYYRMFSGCTSLTSAPVLNAAQLVEGCYTNMFDNCKKLNYVKCLATDINASDCLKGWLYNVADTGTFVKSPSMSDWPSGSSGIPTGWTVKDEVVVNPGGGSEGIGYEDWN